MIETGKFTSELLTRLPQGHPDRLVVEDIAARAEKWARQRFFTEREIEILQGMVDGLGRFELAKKYQLSKKTVSNHKTSISRKTKQHLIRERNGGTTPEKDLGLYAAVAYAVENNLVDWTKLPQEPLNALTGSQKGVLDTVAAGKFTPKEVATALGINSKTVYVHFTNIRAKYGIGSNYQLVAIAVRDRMRAGV